jgi:hypothetical protein
MHHAAFGLEYAVWLWLPLIALGVRHHLRHGTGRVPAVFGAIVLPHLIYVAAIGGDHFEYRPQDLYFPFAYLLVYAGLLEIAAMRRGMAVAVAATALVLGGVVALPRDAHVQFPRTYHAGFPGWATALPEGRVYLHPDRDPVMHLPGLRALAAAHRDLLRKITHAFVGIRQEEHRLFLVLIRPEAEHLRKLVHDGVIPEDAYFAMDSVGLIPYVTDLRVLDRLGLNDAHVARFGEISGERLMAHERRARLEYGREQGVDFWPLDAVHSLFRVRDPALRHWVDVAVEHDLDVFIADAGDGWRLLGLLPQGAADARRRFPRLRFVPVADPAARELLLPAPEDAVSRGAG